MAIFNLKKNTEAKVETKVKSTKKKVAKTAVVSTQASAITKSSSTLRNVAGVILRPKMTEKATILSEQGRGVYLFEVVKGSTKRTVSDAIQMLYKVTPTKVAVLRVPPKKSFVRGHVSYGVTKYKAYVYLKPGDKIEIA